MRGFRATNYPWEGEVIKRFLFAAVFMALLLSCASGSAKTLEQILKEKGVITEADFKEATGARPVSYQPGNGFTFTAPGGRVRFLFQYVDKDDVNSSAQNTSLWRIRIRQELHVPGAGPACVLAEMRNKA